MTVPVTEGAAATGTKTDAARGRWAPTPLFWTVSAVLAIVALISLITGGLGSFLIVLGLAAGITGAIAVLGRRPTWAALPARLSMRGGALAAGVGLIVIGAVVAGTTHPAQAPRALVPAVESTTHRIVESPAATPTATPTPTPAPVLVTAVTSQSPSDAQNALTASGFQVAISTSDGRAAPSDWTGWTITGETPAAGAAVPPGSTITLVATPPAPPPPPPPAPAPAPVQQAPAAPDHPAGATALCRDGTFSYSAHHQGSCSYHGGVAQFFS